MSHVEDVAAGATAGVCLTWTTDRATLVAPRGVSLTGEEIFIGADALDLKSCGEGALASTVRATNGALGAASCNVFLVSGGTTALRERIGDECVPSFADRLM